MYSIVSFSEHSSCVVYLFERTNSASKKTTHSMKVTILNQALPELSLWLPLITWSHSAF